ncbi:MAG: MGMT family protein [Desulfovibrionaceae bacterium]|nr:MGMT family protein [Desulfovibrionaceae bacterium]
MAVTPFTQKVMDCIRNIPRGKVATYGGIAAMAGNRLAARQVARILHTCSRTGELPWHRVVNREGGISLPEHRGYDRQKILLLREGVEFDRRERIDLDRFLWRP